jgi:hypoxanthine phosphoribosyltransferase
VTKTLIKSADIDMRISELATQINESYGGVVLDVVCLTNSAMIFTSDLVRRLDNVNAIHRLAFESYDPPARNGQVRLTLDIDVPLDGKYVLVTEGMVISGRTPSYICQALRGRGAQDVKIATVGWKPALLMDGFKVDFAMFEFGDEFVAGYGIGNSSIKASADLMDARG